MSRVQMVSHKGKQVVYLDFSGCKAADLHPIIDEAKRVIANQPKESALILSNVTDTEISKDTSQIMKDFTLHNKPFVKASAIIGVEGLKKIIYNAVQSVSGRHISSFSTADQAKDWLIAQ
jgi:hypothetical protein